MLSSTIHACIHSETKVKICVILSTLISRGVYKSEFFVWILQSVFSGSHGSHTFSLWSASFSKMSALSEKKRNTESARFMVWFAWGKKTNSVREFPPSQLLALNCLLLPHSNSKEAEKFPLSSSGKAWFFYFILFWKNKSYTRVVKLYIIYMSASLLVAA